MKPLRFLDVECYPNFFVVGVRDKIGKYSFYSENVDELKSIWEDYRWVTFNGVRYDFPMIAAYFKWGNNPSVLYKVSQSIIQNKISQEFRELKNNFIYQRGYDLVDLIDIAPGVMVNLKMYGARMHYPDLEDLPYSPDTVLNDEQKEKIKSYNKKDLDITWMLYTQLKEEIELRDNISEHFKSTQNLNIKGNAALGEWLVVHNLKRNANLSLSKVVEYQSPDIVKTKIEIPPIEIDELGKPILKGEVFSKAIKIGGTLYKIGLGGLHSQEKNFISPKGKIWNADVTSFYPSLILRYGFKPKQYGEAFLKQYRKIFEERIEAKKNGNKLINSAYKLALNSVFGKLGNKYSSLYDPSMLLAVTFTGQLLLLDLIYALEAKGHRVLSANTDGIEFQSVDDSFKELLKDWEENSGLMLEVSSYDRLYSRDVNNYIAVWGEKLKCKGIYADPDLKKSWEHPIVYDAIKNSILKGVPLEETIRNCKDFNKFLLLRNVTGGCTYRGEFKGRIARWYYGNEGFPILYAKNGNKVAKSDNAIFVSNLKGNKWDINFDYYIELAENTFPFKKGKLMD